MKHITIKELTAIEDMQRTYDLLTVLYPNNFSKEKYNELLQEMIRSNYRQIIAIDRERIVAVAGLTIATKIWSGRYMDMDHVIVDRDYRGMGIGKQLLAYTKRLCKQENCQILSCDVYSENFDAQRFYMNEQFVPRGFHFIHTFDKNLDLKAYD